MKPRNIYNPLFLFMKIPPMLLKKNLMLYLVIWKLQQLLFILTSFWVLANPKTVGNNFLTNVLYNFVFQLTINKVSFTKDFWWVNFCDCISIDNLTLNWKQTRTIPHSMEGPVVTGLKEITNIVWNTSFWRVGYHKTLYLQHVYIGVPVIS